MKNVNIVPPPVQQNTYLCLRAYIDFTACNLLSDETSHKLRRNYFTDWNEKATNALRVMNI